MSTVQRPSSAVPVPLRARGLLARRPRPSGQKYKREDMVIGYLFVLFPFAIFLTFSILGMVFDFWMSFHRWAVIDTPVFNGSANYNYIFRVDPVFWTAIWNTIQYSFFVVIIQTIISFTLALIVNQNIRGKKFFRTTFYFPSVTSSVAISLIFLYLFNNLGLINYALSLVGITGPNWLGDPHTALKSIMGLNIWTTTGTLMVIFLAALQDVPRDTLEAAAIDGATGVQAVIRVILPQIRPAIFFVVANGIIGTLQIFDQAFIMSGGTGAPENSTMTAVLYIYNQAFTNGFYGVAAAASFVLFCFIFVATFVVRRVLEPQE
jgi:multiple sugar transport system permease protein